MAVEAQYHLNTSTTAINIFKDHRYLAQQHQILKRTVLTNPELNLAASGSRKRSRDEGLIVQQQQPPHHFSTNPSASQHNIEIEDLIRLHNAKLRSGLDEIQNRHCRQILTIVEQQAAATLSAKETEIERAKQRQTELEVRLRQLSAENRVWFTVAKNSEAVASGLKAKLDQVLRHTANGSADHHPAAADQAEDAESCCFEEGSCGGDRRRLCRVCGEKDVSILLLPCRHLCVCGDCGLATDTCPICSGAKSVGLEVFMG